MVILGFFDAQRIVVLKPIGSPPTIATSNDSS